MNDKQMLLRAAAIQRYLIANPKSTDTLNGIHQYWIRLRGDQDTIDVTLAALEYLTVAGFMESTTAGNRQLWRRAVSPATHDAEDSVKRAGPATE
jgi:acyl-CoA thioesterase